MPNSEPVLSPRAERYGLGQSAEWDSLLRHFELGEGFALLILTVPDNYGADVCRETLARWLEQRGELLYQIPAQTVSELVEVPHRLINLKLPEQTGAVWISSAIPESDPDFEHWRNAWVRVAASLNRVRDTIARSMRQPLILVGAPWVETMISETAPDLWSIRKMVTSITPPALGKRQIVLPPEPPVAAEEQTLDPDFALEQANRLKGREGQENHWAELALRAAEALTRSARLEEAEQVLKEIIANDLLNDPTRIAALSLLANVEYRRKDYQSSLKHTEQSLQLIRKSADGNDSTLPVLGSGLQVLATLYQELNRPDEAIEAGAEAVDVWRKLVDGGESQHTSELASGLELMGRLYVERGRWPEAEAVLTEGLTRRRALGDEEFHRARLVSSLSRLGMIYSQTQRYHEAEQVAREAASILESLGDQEKYSNTEAYVLQALGLALVLQGNRSEALSTMRRAQTLAQDEELKDTIRQQLEGILAESPDPH